LFYCLALNNVQTSNNDDDDNDVINDDFDVVNIVRRLCFRESL